MKSQRTITDLVVESTRPAKGRLAGSRRLASGLGALALASTLAFGATACGRTDSGPAPGVQKLTQLAGPSTSERDADPASTPFAESRLFGDPLEHVAHRGVRVVETWTGEDGLDHAAVRDELVTDGDGGFALRHLEALTPVTPSEPLYGLLKEHRQAFHFRYMMFRPIDRVLFLRNWKVSETGLEVTLQGRPSVELRITHRQTPNASQFRVLMDEETGLVLSVERTDHDGILRSRMTYESVDFAPDLSGVVFHRSTLVETPLDPTQGLDKQMGFDVHTPRLLPKYYRPVEVVRLSAPGQKNWIKIVYSDGIDTLFFLQEEVVEAPSRMEVSIGTPTLGGPLFADDRRSDTLYFRDFGPVTVLDMNVFERHTFLMGRHDAAQLLDVANSTLPEDYLRLGRNR